MEREWDEDKHAAGVGEGSVEGSVEALSAAPGAEAGKEAVDGEEPVAGAATDPDAAIDPDAANDPGAAIAPDATTNPDAATDPDATIDPGPGGALRAGIHLAATPIGNPADASARLRHALGAADIVAAEDTRRARSLASALGIEIRGRIVSFFEHNETARAPWLVERAEDGDSILVVTDAGMPSVSDPGFAVVAEAMTADVPVTCLPGPSAVTTALVLSGLPVDRFAFDGFPPRKAGKRRAWLSGLAQERRTVVFFESPHRLAATLADAAEVLGAERPAAVCRELTKTYEEVLRGGLGELAERTADGVLGEIVVVLGPAAEKEATADDVDAAVDDVLRLAEAEGIRVKDAAGRVAAETGLSRKVLYDAAVARR